MLKSIVNAWTGISLIWRIAIGLVIGALLGVFAPSGIEAISLLGDLFVGALKAIAPILVFFLVMSALASANADLKGMKTIVILYICSTLLAGFVAVGASFLFPVEITFANPEDLTQAPPEGIAQVLTTLLTNMVANPVKALVEANYIGILFWSIIFGIALRMANSQTKEVFSTVAGAVSSAVRLIIACAPFGILGLVYTSVSENGIEIFTEYGQLLALLLGSMAVIVFITNPIMVFITTGKNPFPLVWRCIKDSGVTAFFMRSSAANIPVNMDLCAKLGLDKNLYSVSIPLGATINMAGATVTIAVMTMAACNTLGIMVDFPTAVVLCFLAAIGASGCSGVPGGSLMLIPLCCSLFGINNDLAMQVVAIGFIIGVIQDSVETAINSSSDALFTASASYREMKKEGIPFQMGKDAQPQLPNTEVA